MGLMKDHLGFTVFLRGTCDCTDIRKRRIVSVFQFPRQAGLNLIPCTNISHSNCHKTSRHCLNEELKECVVGVCLLKKKTTSLGYAKMRTFFFFWYFLFFCLVAEYNPEATSQEPESKNVNMDTQKLCQKPPGKAKTGCSKPDR